MKTEGRWSRVGKRSVSLDSDMTLLREQKGRIIIISSSSVIGITIIVVIIFINARRPIVLP